MFYEERCIEGRWYWRGTPNGEWNLMGVDQLAQKLAATEAALEEQMNRACKAEKRVEELEGLEMPLTYCQIPGRCNSPIYCGDNFAVPCTMLPNHKGPCCHDGNDVPNEDED
jgi:hypothetical protein